MKVQDIMTGEPRSLTPDSTVREAAQLMKEINAGVIPVVEAGSKKLVGVVTDRDLAIRVVAEGKDSQCRVSDVMSSGSLSTCTPADDVDRVMETMSREQVRRIPIVDERGSLVGIVAQADIVRKADDKKAERTVEKISQPGREARA
jgi:CBS domain-containing protein